MSRVKRIASRVAWGVVAAVLYYLIYMVLLPTFIAQAVGPQGVPLPTGQASYWIAGMLLVSLGFIERVLEHPVAAAFRVLSKVVGAIVLYILTNGGVITATISEGGSTLTVTADLSLLIYSLMAISMVMGIVDAGSAVIEYSSAKPD